VEGLFKQNQYNLFAFCLLAETLISCYNKQLLYSLFVLKAHYDNNGNIILEGATPPPSDDADVSESHTIPVPEGKGETKELLMPTVSQRKSRQPSFVQKALYQSKIQSSAEYGATAENVISTVSDAVHDAQLLPKRIHRSLKTLWKNINTPLILQRKKSRKPTTKLRMFLVDTVRFGGTFALIFSVLFVGINYQSFFQIARAELALGSDIKTEEALQNITYEKTGVDKRSFTSNNRAESSFSILGYLPSVGPFEDRLIIPKLGKNVPIVSPSMDALIQENWKQFENDIQDALHHGVVHYPGSAKPGQAGNFFLTGHSSYYPWDNGKYKDVFALLPQLEVGDTYSVYYGGDKHTYRVSKKYEVKPSDVTVLDQPTTKRIATLMTCTPIGTTLRRLIVQAEEIDPVTGDILHVGEKTEDSMTTLLRKLEALPI